MKGQIKNELVCMEYSKLAYAAWILYGRNLSPGVHSRVQALPFRSPKIYTFWYWPKRTAAASQARVHVNPWESDQASPRLKVNSMTRRPATVSLTRALIFYYFFGIYRSYTRNVRCKTIGWYTIGNRTPSVTTAPSTSKQSIVKPTVLRCTVRCMWRNEASRSDLALCCLINLCKI